MIPVRMSFFLVLGVLGMTVGVVEAQTLRGSAASLDRQNVQARAHDFTYLRTPAQVRSFVENGYLVAVVPNGDFDLHQVSFPYARPEVRVFIERLAAQYRGACSEKLVVTSLTRPLSNQPVNASSRSVHPTGMAVDLRRSGNARCRQWLESTLLSLESAGVLEAIYERNPPHYHVAVYPRPYTRYLAQRTGDTQVMARSVQNGPEMEVRWVTHRVRPGDTLIGLANRYGTAVGRIRTENGIRGDRLMAGQEVQIPVYQAASEPQVASDASESAVSTASAALPTSPPPVIPEAAVASPSGEPSEGPVPGALHTVARGESLWTIARRYGVSEDAIRVVNGVRGSRILVGERLVIPAEAGWNGVLEYTVQRGESLWTIANRHGTSVDEIRRRNGMDTTRIYAGQVLNVPLSF